MSEDGMIYLEPAGNSRKKFIYAGVVAAVIAAAALIVFILPALTGGSSLLSGGAALKEELPDPVQTEYNGQVKMTVDDYDVTITEKYSYTVDALVVHTRNYSGSSLGNRLSPRDFALAWGKIPMYNDTIDFNWGQSGRWYTWSVDSYDTADKVGGVKYIETHSANTHIIPADDEVRKEIKKVDTGDHVILTGYLVSIYGKNSEGDTFTWNSSTTREDTGDGACEVMYVTGVEIR